MLFRQKRPTWLSYRADCVPYEVGCRQCGKPIGFFRAYCSRDCQKVFEANHFWNTASHEALMRARPERKLHVPPICKRCGKECGWLNTLGYGRREAEVNHIVPLNGQRSHFSCAHHQENLEVLCHGCHVQVGVEQRRAGLIGRRAA